MNFKIGNIMFEKGFEQYYIYIHNIKIHDSHYYHYYKLFNKFTEDAGFCRSVCSIKDDAWVGYNQIILLTDIFREIHE